MMSLSQKLIRKIRILSERISAHPTIGDGTKGWRRAISLPVALAFSRFAVRRKGKVFRMLGLIICTALIALDSGLEARAASPETEVRATVQQVFDELKRKNFDALYDSLPSSTRSRLARD